MSFGLEKAWWTIGLILSLRGIGWNWEVKDVPRPSQTARRWTFVFSQSVKVVVAYCAETVAAFFSPDFDPGSPRFPSKDVSWFHTIARPLAGRVQSFCSQFYIWNGIPSIIATAAGWTDPKVDNDSQQAPGLLADAS